MRKLQAKLSQTPNENYRKDGALRRDVDSASGIPVVLPLVHMGGTSGQRLLEELEDARDKVETAVRAMERCAPDGRDYPTMGELTAAAYREARAYHLLRIDALTEVHAQLDALVDGVQEQIANGAL